MNILAIDPGNIESAYVIIDEDYKPLEFDKVENHKLLEHMKIPVMYDKVAIEMVAHYGTGMAAGKEVFDTCVWIGRFFQVLDVPVKLVYRKDVKMNLCGNTRAKDGNIIQALIDRFAYGVPNRGKGYKNNPGFFYGFRADIWQAYALAVTYLDGLKGVEA